MSETEQVMEVKKGQTEEEAMQESILQKVDETKQADADAQNVATEADGKVYVTKAELKEVRRQLEDVIDDFKDTMLKAKAQGKATIPNKKDTGNAKLKEIFKGTGLEDGLS